MPGMLDFVLNALDLGQQAALAVTLIAVLLYWRKGKKVAGLLGNGVSYVAVSAAVVGILLLLGIVTGVDMALAVEYVQAAVDGVSGFVGDLVESVL